MLIISPYIIYHKRRNEMTVLLHKRIPLIGKKAIGVGLKRSKEPASARGCRGENQSSRIHCTALLSCLAALLTFDAMSMDPAALPLPEDEHEHRHGYEHGEEDTDILLVFRNPKGGIDSVVVKGGKRVLPTINYRRGELLVDIDCENLDELNRFLVGEILEYPQEERLRFFRCCKEGVLFRDPWFEFACVGDHPALPALAELVRRESSFYSPGELAACRSAAVPFEGSVGIVWTRLLVKGEDGILTEEKPIMVTATIVTLEEGELERLRALGRFERIEELETLRRLGDSGRLSITCGHFLRELGFHKADESGVFHLRNGDIGTITFSFAHDAEEFPPEMRNDGRFGRNGVGVSEVIVFEGSSLYDVAFLRLKRPIPGARSLPMQAVTADMWNVADLDELDMSSPYFGLVESASFVPSRSVLSMNASITVGFGKGSDSSTDAKHDLDPIDGVLRISNREEISQEDERERGKGGQILKARSITGGVCSYSFEVFNMFIDVNTSPTSSLLSQLVQRSKYFVSVRAPDGEIHRVSPFILSQGRVMTTPGDSGSPIFLNGELIGVVTGCIGRFLKGCPLTPEALVETAEAFARAERDGGLPGTEAAAIAPTVDEAVEAFLRARAAVAPTAAEAAEELSGE
jgi:hypothetical protein